VSHAQALLAEKLLIGLRNESGVDLERVTNAIRRGFEAGVNPVRAALAAGVAIEALERVAWWHQGYDVAEVNVPTLDPALLGRIPVAVCKQLKVIPLDRRDGQVRVAVSDPDNLGVLDDIRKRFAPEPVCIMVADAQVIEAALSSLEHRAVSSEFSFKEEEEAQGGALAALEEDGGEGRIAQMVTKTIEMAVAMRASDIHIEPAEDHVRVRLRVDGVLTEVARYPIGNGQGVINNLKVRAGLDVAERRIPQDGRVTVNVAGRSLDLRLVTLPNVWRCEGAVMRILDRSRGVIPLERLGYTTTLRERWEKLAASPYGALLATGPTGSGKTTCLYSTLSLIATPQVKVCTVEDPVEFRFPGLMQMQVENKAGRSFATALKSFLRSDPDVILVGEIRDKETATIAVEAALTGHLLLASLHANTAASAPTRLIEMGIEPYLVASAVRGVLSQRLARKLCTACRVAIPTPADMFSSLAPVELPPQVFKAADRGCSRCGGTGYSGRIAIAEVLAVGEEVSAAIANGAHGTEILAIAKREGMVPMYEAGLAFVLEGTTSIEELTRVIN
jgi:type IV pilus assembly protein PilB